MAASSSSAVDSVSEASGPINPESTEESKETGSNESILEEQNLESLQGKRIGLFCKALKKSVDNIIGAGTGRPGKSNEPFKEVQKKNPEAYSSITQQLMDHLRSNIDNEVKLMIKQERLVDLFSELDKIEEIQKPSAAKGSNKPEHAWRPSGVPLADSRDHVMQVKLNAMEQLKQILEPIEKENELLKEIVVPRRDRLIVKEQELYDKSKDLDKTVELCEAFDTKSFQEQSDKLRL